MSTIDEKIKNDSKREVAKIHQCGIIDQTKLIYFSNTKNLKNKEKQLL